MVLSARYAKKLFFNLYKSNHLNNLPSILYTLENLFSCFQERLFYIVTSVKIIKEMIIKKF